MRVSKLILHRVVTIAMALAGCGGQDQAVAAPAREAVSLTVPQTVPQAVPQTAPQQGSRKVRNIILMIGDGMGPQQVGLLQTYARRAPHSIYRGRPTHIDRLLDVGVLGLSDTAPRDTIVADSACSATQLATGYPVPNEVIGVGPQGEQLQTIVEQAKMLGKATGLVSDTRLAHATPAAFAAHRAHRSMQDEIAEDMIRIAPDVMLSGGLRRFVPAQVNDQGAVYDALVALTDNSFSLSSKRKDNLDLLARASQAGFELVFNKTQMNAARGDKLLGLFADSAMMDGIEYSATRASQERTEPTLEEMAAKALAVLERNEQGFFLMIEGGQIDWAGHQNDAGTMLHEMIKFDDALGYVLDWVMQREDTLLIVTADHETGSFGFSYSKKHEPNKSVLRAPGSADELHQPMYNFADLSLLDKLYAQRRSNKLIWHDFTSLPAGQQTPATLAGMMTRHHDFEVTEAMAARVLGRVNNRAHVAGQRPLKGTMWPALHDLFDDFYVYADLAHVNLMGHVLAEQQSVVWGTGTHTNTPVLVMAYGPLFASERFSGYLTHPEIGEIAKKLF